jgi:hypothetical protein
MSDHYSNREGTNFRRDRREWLKTSATAIGATLIPVTETLAEPQATIPQAPVPEKPSPAKTPARFFTPAEHRMIEELSETIIPADSHSGGAQAAKVADYIEQVVGSSSEDSQRSMWREGLRLVDSMSRHYNGKTFVDASSEQRIAVMKVLSDNDRLTDIPEVRLYNELKHLTIRGYYTSKIGIHDELEYKGNRILMEYVGCDDPTPKASA